MVKTTHALPVFTLLGSALAAFPHILPADNLPTRSVLATRAPSKANNTIVQLFEWNWVSPNLKRPGPLHPQDMC